MVAIFFAIALAIHLARITPGAQAVTPASVAGTYHYKTYRPGKGGYDNTLKVKDRGGGKLHISLSGAYMYRANGAETMHEGAVREMQRCAGT